MIIDFLKALALGIIIGILFYFGSRLQMKAWLTEVEIFLKNKSKKVKQNERKKD